ncbi:MAG TPA: CHRD domain-containing protein [Planctomycetota bacterium]|nr:CHRD domain-containing protein [Planctomycetota bacterium]
MKNLRNAPRIVRVLVATGALALAGLVGYVWASPRRGGPSEGDKLTTFIAVLNSGQETDQPDSQALGVGFFFFNETTNQLTYNISYQGLTANESVSHIHGPAVPTVTAPVLINFGNPNNPKNGTLDVTPDQEKLLKKGLLYVNIHTEGPFSSGEIRGQILPMKAKYSFTSGG